MSPEIINLLKRILKAASVWGDMLKSVYDSNADGIVNDSDKLESNTLAQVRANVLTPDYDSGWVEVSYDETKTFTHNLGTRDLLPVIYYRTAVGYAWTLWGCGQTDMGDAWLNSDDVIQVYNHWEVKEIRVMLFKITIV